MTCAPSHRTCSHGLTPSRPAVTAAPLDCFPLSGTSSQGAQGFRVSLLTKGKTHVPLATFLPSSQRRFWAGMWLLAGFIGARIQSLVESTMGPNKGRPNPDFQRSPQEKRHVSQPVFRTPLPGAQGFCTLLLLPRSLRHSHSFIALEHCKQTSGSSVPTPEYRVYLSAQALPHQKVSSSLRQ